MSPVKSFAHPLMYLAVTASVSIVTGPPGQAADVSITLQPDTTFQRMAGVGGNFCQGDQIALVNSKRYDDVFGPAGLNLAFIRVAQCVEVADPQYAAYDAATATVIKEFRSRQPDGSVMMTAWSPPETLKSNNSVYGGTLDKDANGSYRYAEYGAWWARALAFYQSKNALPDYVSIQNETNWTPTPSNPALSYEAGCQLNPTEGATFAGYPQALAATKQALTSAKFAVPQFIGPDTAGIREVASYLSAMAPGDLDAIAHHSYRGKTATTGASLLTTLRSQNPGATIFMSEMNPGDTSAAGQPDWMGPVMTMHNHYVLENASTYLVWSIMWGTVNPYNGLADGTESYYPIAHYSRFIRPGALRGDLTLTGALASQVAASLWLNASAAPTDPAYVLVLINTGATDATVSLATSPWWSASTSNRMWKVYQTANTVAPLYRLNLQESLSGNAATGDRSLTLPAYSITTALINTLKSQTITFPTPPILIVAGADRVPGATTTSGLAIAYNSSDPAVVSIVNGKLHAVAPGKATITATQDGGLPWAKAVPVSVQVTVVNDGSPLITIPAAANPGTVIVP